MRSLPAVLVLLLASSAPGKGSEPSQGLDGLEVTVLARRGSSELIAAHPPVPPDCSPEQMTHDLYERDAQGRLRRLARDVTTAAYTPDGAVLYVQGERLMELSAGEAALITAPVIGDIAVDPLGVRIAVVRPDEEPTSWIELIDRAGRHLAVLTEPDGPNAWPVFSPDGDRVFFLSGRSGVYSWFGVGADGRGLAQLTNVGLEPGPDTVGERFVPPPASRDRLRFLDRATVEYDDGEVLWRVDLETGRASAADGRQR